MQRLVHLTFVAIIMGCGGAGPATTATSSAPSPSASATVTATAAPLPAGAVRFVADAKSAATVRVEEHLAVNLVNTDAVLDTDRVTGQLTLLADGTFAPDSKIIVDMTRLRSNEALRDRWIQLFGIETNKFKESVFVPDRATGLPAPLPPTGEWTFTLAGTLTVHGVAQPVTWQTTAKREGRSLTGRATTTVRWGDFGVQKPQAAVTQVVSVSDDVRIEVNFVGTQTP